LAAGDHVIVEGWQKVRPGAAAKEVPFAAGSGQAEKPAGAGQPAPTSH
jgi:hypothetical protein